jgi:hypothetical protein
VTGLPLTFNRAGMSDLKVRVRVRVRVTVRARV